MKSPETLERELAASLRFHVVCRPGSPEWTGWNVRDTATGRLRSQYWTLTEAGARGVCALANGDPDLYARAYLYR